MSGLFLSSPPDLPENSETEKNKEIGIPTAQNESKAFISDYYERESTRVHENEKMIALKKKKAHTLHRRVNQKKEIAKEEEFMH